MKILSIALVSVILVSCSAQNEKKDNVASTIAQSSSSTTVVSSTNTATEPKANVAAALESTGKNARYYYDKFVNIDSEEPSIGVGPRTIVKEDIANGTIVYKFNNETATRTLTVYNKIDYDIVDFPGNPMIVNGAKLINLNDGNADADKLVKSVGDARSARGGECDYMQYALYTIDKTKQTFAVKMGCTDDETFRETVGYVTLVGGKVVVTKK